ncbi:MAG: peptidoglycan DD-metalloendopeptidase family protein [Cyanobacteria bacterium J06554_6]
MDASTPTARSVFTYRFCLLQLSLVSGLGLIGGQVVFAQTEDAPALEITAPAAPAASPAPAAPAVTAPTPATPTPAAPVVTTPAPQPSTPQPAAPSPTFAPAQPPVEVITPNDIVPTAIPTAAPASEPDSGTASAATDQRGPADLGSVFVDPTDYSVGATQPEVIFSERSSGCQFAVQNGHQIPGGACAQPSTPAVAQGGSSPQGRSFNVGPVSISASGVQISGGTTAASRDYYNRAARPIVNLQLGEKFIFPLSIPAPITSLFGWRLHPIHGEQRFHAGTDLGAPLGTPIVATQAGRVAIADFLGGYGLTVVLRHDEDSIESRYAHMARLLVQPGEWVEQGDVIGLVGSTGNSTGPHLHFELRQLTGDGWVALNPDLLIQQTLARLMQSLNNPLLALGVQAESGEEKSDAENVPAPEAKLPFRPAQPNAN